MYLDHELGREGSILHHRFPPDAIVTNWLTKSTHASALTLRVPSSLKLAEETTEDETRRASRSVPPTPHGDDRGDWSRPPEGGRERGSRPFSRPGFVAGDLLDFQKLCQPLTIPQNRPSPNETTRRFHIGEILLYPVKVVKVSRGSAVYRHYRLSTDRALSNHVKSCQEQPLV